MCILIQSEPSFFQSPQCTRHGSCLGLLLDEFTCRLKSGGSLLTLFASSHNRGNFYKNKQTQTHHEEFSGAAQVLYFTTNCILILRILHSTCVLLKISHRSVSGRSGFKSSEGHDAHVTMIICSNDCALIK